MCSKDRADVCVHGDGELRRAPGLDRDIHEHLLTRGQQLSILVSIKVVDDVQAFAVVINYLGEDLNPLTQFGFTKVIDVGLKRVQRVPIDAAGINIKTDMIHQGVSSMAEDQEVIGIAQMTVVVDPVLDDCSLVDKQKVVHD